MLNREEYNFAFNHDLSEEAFKEIMGNPINPFDENLEYLTFVSEDGKHKREFAPVRHGHWIPIDPDSRGWSTVFKCSVCHCITAYPYVTNGMDYDYCPNCGVIMDEKGWKNE